MDKATRILVVDDDPALLELYCEMLRGVGYAVSNASTGQEGLRLTREKRPDLVLLDVALPDLSGIEVCRKIKADAELADVFVVLFSGRAADTDHKVAGLAAGADEYMVKSVDIDEFLARIRMIARLRETTAALRTSEQHYRRLVEILPEAVALLDLRGRLRAINAKGVAMLGYADPSELLRKSAFDLIWPEEHERVRADIAATLATGTLRTTEYTLLRSGGQPFPAELSTTVATDGNGRATGLVFVVRDITERRRAEEQIRLLADAVQSTGELICITDARDRLIFVNRAFQQAYGYSESEILGKTPDILMSRKNPRSLLAEILIQTRSGGWRGEVLERRRDGSEFPVFLSTSLIKDPSGKILGLMGVARDITERKQAEKRAAAFSLLGYGLSAATTPEQAASIILEIASDLLGWDAAYLHLYSQNEDRIIPILTMDTVDGQRTPISEGRFTLDPSPLMRSVMKEGARLINRADESALETKLVPFGDTTRLSASMMYVPVQSGRKVVGILSIQSYIPRRYTREDLSSLQELADRCADALERIEVADALQQAEANYRSIFENATEGIFQTSPEGRYLSANVALARMFGYESPQEMMSSVADIESQTYVLPEARRELKRLLDSQPSVQGLEVERYRKDGTRFWMSINARAVRDGAGKILYYVGTSQDITARKNALEALNQSERKLRLIAENTTDVIFAFDMNRQPLYVNSAVEALTGYTFAEIQTRKFVNWIHPTDQERMLKLWEGLYAGKGYSEVEFRLITKSGEMKWCSSTWGPMLDENGRQVGVQGRERDITKLKQAEQQRAALSQLGHRLSAASDPEQAAKIIFEAAADLFSYDAGYVALYSKEEGRIIPVLVFDTVDGQRVPFPITSFPRSPTPLMRLVIEQGRRLVRQTDPLPPGVKLVRFGNTDHRFACAMFVPILSGGVVMGLLSLQSYWPGAYSEADLDLLQNLAEYCAGALRRIEVREALRQAEAKYRSIVENASEGIFQSTPHGRLISANPALARMFGFESPAEMVSSVSAIGRQLYVLPERRDELRRLLDTQGSVQGFECENYRKDGRRIWISLDVRAVRDAAGAIEYFEGTIRDITERKWAEELLQVQRDFGMFLSSTDDLGSAAERLLKLALENEGVDCGAVYLVDAHTGALDLIAQQGLSVGFIRQASHIVAETSQPRGAGSRRARPRRRRWPLTELVRLLKQEGWLAMETLPMQHGGRVVAALNVGSHVYREIPLQSCRVIEAIATQAAGAVARILAERSSRANREMFEKMVHGLQAAVLIVDADTDTVLECNPAATHVFGYHRDELIGHSAALLHLNEELRREFFKHLASTVEGKGFLTEFEFEMKRKDGTSFPVANSVMPVTSEAGRVAAWVAVIRDITERKRVEEGLREVSRRIIEAQEAERLRVARELHDGVNQIIASAKMRLRKVGDATAGLGPAAREILQRCDRLLVQALEENRRIAHGLRPSDLDALGLATACRNFCKEFQARTNLTMSCSVTRLGERLPPAVQLNLFRIAQEAINNVEKHAQAKNVRLSMTFHRDEVVLRITDDGRGFDAGGVRHAKPKGHGIGLTNIRERAASLGGTYEVESGPGQGTILTVRVPCKRPE